jgi:2Fe-2S ferredoxin
MSTAVFQLPDGEICRVEARPGQSLMQAAKTGGVPGIDADCGGSMVCGTCHVIVPQHWLDRLPAPSEMEAVVLEGVPESHPRARLACQIQIDASLDGIEVTVPSAQR